MIARIARVSNGDWAKAAANEQISSIIFTMRFFTIIFFVAKIVLKMCCENREIPKLW